MAHHYPGAGGKGIMKRHALAEMAVRAVLKEVILRPPYDGAKDYFFISDVDGQEYLTQLIKITIPALPRPKAKKKVTSRCVKWGTYIMLNINALVICPFRLCPRSVPELLRLTRETADGFLQTILGFL